jgi:hypothetical protein
MNSLTTVKYLAACPACGTDAQWTAIEGTHTVSVTVTCSDCPNPPLLLRMLTPPSVVTVGPTPPG